MWFKLKNNIRKIDKNEVRSYALKRISDVFSVPFDSLKYDDKFGVDLNCTYVSDLKFNEIDMIYHDLRDVATREILEEIEDGLVVINTVGEYCEYMVRCSDVNAEEVAYVLGIPD